MTITTGGTDLELIDGTTVVPLMIRQILGHYGDFPPGDPQIGAPMEKTLSEVLTAATADSPLAEWLEPVIQESWARGAGQDYNAAPGCNTRMGITDPPLGHVVPAGAATEVPVTVAGNSSSRVTAIVEYAGDLWFAQQGDGTINTARVMRSPGGTGTLSADLTLGVNEYIRDLLVADDGAGNSVLWATSSNVAASPTPFGAGLSGRVHKYNSTVGFWVSTVAALFGTNGRNALAKVHWTTSDGLQAWRLVTISRTNTIAYTKPFADPLLAASWVENVRVDTAAGLFSLAAARRHIYIGAGDGLYDLDEQGNTPNLISYELPRHDYNGVSSRYQQNYVYMSAGPGIQRIYVGQNGVLQERDGQCAPTWFTGAEHQYGGICTAIAEDQGWLLPAFYNPITHRSSIWYGIDRQAVNTPSPNPLIWHGPEIVSNQDLRIWAMKATSLGAGGGMRLWIAAQRGDGVVPPWVGYVSVPLQGTPLSDLMSSGLHRFARGNGTDAFNAAPALYSLPETWKDKAATKIIYQNTFGSRGLDVASGTKLTTYTRADPDPGSTAWGAGVDVTAGPTQSVTPAVVTSGHKLEYRVDFVSPSGTATPAKVGVLDAVRREAWRIVTAFRVYDLDVELGDGIWRLDNNQDDTFSPEQRIAQIKAMTETGKITLRLRDNSRWTVKLRQVMDIEHHYGEGTYGQRVRARIQVALLAQL